MAIKTVVLKPKNPWYSRTRNSRRQIARCVFVKLPACKTARHFCAISVQERFGGPAPGVLISRRWDHGFDKGKTSHGKAPRVFLATNDTKFTRRFV